MNKLAKSYPLETIQSFQPFIIFFFGGGGIEGSAGLQTIFSCDNFILFLIHMPKKNGSFGTEHTWNTCHNAIFSKARILRKRQSITDGG